ncbi:MAG: hypothetical protein QOK61_07705, partial [Nitrososphaeraceae archaeon]|nr:hypothetical protein [Nitrososphaeraceae archaeon]
SLLGIDVSNILHFMTSRNTEKVIFIICSISNDVEYFQFVIFIYSLNLLKEQKEHLIEGC